MEYKGKNNQWVDKRRGNDFMEKIPERVFRYYKNLFDIHSEPIIGICARCGADDGEEVYGYSTTQGIFSCFLCEECRNTAIDRPNYLKKAIE